jgi:hypothetical protein
LGSQPGAPRMFELDWNVNVYANGGGFGCAIFEPSSWTPSNGTELPYPAQVTIGGPGGNGSAGIVRTPFCLYTGEGDTSATQVVPATGTAMDPPPAGLGRRPRCTARRRHSPGHHGRAPGSPCRGCSAYAGRRASGRASRRTDR